MERDVKWRLKGKREFRFTSFLMMKVHGTLHVRIVMCFGSEGVGVAGRWDTEELVRKEHRLPCA